MLTLYHMRTDALPHFLATTGNKLNLAGTAWFSIVSTSHAGMWNAFVERSTEAYR